MSHAKSLPHSNEAERAVLGGVMLDPRRVGALSEILTPDDFYQEKHALLWALMLDMHSKRQPVEMTAVIERIVRRQCKREAGAYGGCAYVSSLPDNVPSTVNLDHYAGIVRDRATRRRVALAARQISIESVGGERETAELVQWADSLLLGASRQETKGGLEHISETGLSELEQAFDDVDARQRGEVVGVPLMCRPLAEYRGGETSILAARPAMGKTAKMLCEVYEAAQCGHSVAIFSMEMVTVELKKRLITIMTGLSFREAMCPVQRDRARSAWREIGHMPIHISDTPQLNHRQIRARIRAMIRKDPGLSIVFIDYIGLCGAVGKENNYERVKAFSGHMKMYAKEFKIHIRMLCQLGRGLESRQDKRPILSDLRDAGDIEQDADIVEFIYRDEVYAGADSHFYGVAELICRKQRNGPTGTRFMGWEGRCFTFSAIDAEQEQRYSDLARSLRSQKKGR